MDREAKQKILRLREAVKDVIEEIQSVHAAFDDLEAEASASALSTEIKRLRARIADLEGECRHKEELCAVLVDASAVDHDPGTPEGRAAAHGARHAAAVLRRHQTPAVAKMSLTKQGQISD